MLSRFLDPLPLIAILRGITPRESGVTARILYDAGFRCIEVPLNSPEPLASIARMRELLPADCLIGAGTVCDVQQVKAVQRAGGELIVMPHSDPAVVQAAKACGLSCMPGVATPTEAFAALANGADALKLFPAEQITPQILKAWRSVLPQQAALFPVGGITPAKLAGYRAAGASGFGLGSALYVPGLKPTDIRDRADAFVAAFQDCSPADR
jgi:2-dehydro-3-deoxyphosphogalactonate aldolase